MLRKLSKFAPAAFAVTLLGVVATTAPVPANAMVDPMPKPTIVQKPIAMDDGTGLSSLGKDREGPDGRLRARVVNKELDRARMGFYANDSAAANDLQGVQSTTYTGKFYRASQEPKRLCIVKRESEGYYTVKNSAGYMGAYQMSDALADGATWMMAPEHKKLLGKKEAKKVLAQLRATPFNQWNRYWQDAAFWTVYNWEGSGSGAQHWAGGRWSC